MDLYISKANFVEFRKEDIRNYYDFEKVLSPSCRKSVAELMESSTKQNRS